MASRNQEQQQQQNTGQNLQLQELNYYAYEDMMNVLTIASQLDEFENYINTHPEIQDKAKDLRIVQRNRLIVQINLSNTIHADLKNTAQSDHLENELQRAKSGCQVFATKYVNTFKSPFIKDYLESYLTNNLSQGNCLNTKDLLKTERKVKFNQKNLQEVFVCMNKQDNIMADIKKNGFTPSTDEKMQQRLQQTRAETAQKVAKINFNTINEDMNNDCCILF